MAAIIDQAHIEQAYRVASELFGPDAWVPWWAWLALLVMIFWGLLVPDGRGQPAAGRAGGQE